MSNIVRTFPEPTDVYLIGVDFEGEIPEEFVYDITDDYTTIGIANDTVHDDVETAGAVVIVTYEELKQHRALFEMSEDTKEYASDADLNVTVLKDMVGDMTLHYITNLGRDVLTEYVPGVELMYQPNELAEAPYGHPEYVQDYVLRIPDGIEIRSRFGAVDFFEKFDAKVAAEQAQ